jgi:hypothetical protein
MSQPVPRNSGSIDSRLDALASYVKWVRDCGAAAIASGAAVAFVLIVGGIAIRREVYVALVVSYGALLFVAAFFWCRALGAVQRANPGNLISALAPPVLIIGLALANFYDARWPIRPYTRAWWEVVFFALLVALLGWWRRREAGALLAEIAESPGKRRR